MIISVDDLYAFKSCPLKFKLIWIDGFGGKRRKTKSQVFRESMLSAVMYFYENLEENKLIPESKLRERFKAEMELACFTYDLVFKESETKRLLEHEGISMLSRFYRQQKFDPDRILMLNQEFVMPFGEGVSVKGRIPIVRETRRGSEIVTFKTSPNPSAEFWTKTDMDLTLQAMAFESMMKKPADSLCIQYLKTGATIFTERGKEQYERLNKSVKLISSVIKENGYYPKEGKQCDACQVQDICARWH